MGENVNAVKITDTSGLIKKTDYNTKIGEIEKKILDHGDSTFTTTQ